MAGYSVTYSVVDQATEKINAINKRIQQLRAPLEAQQKALSKFVDLTSLSKIADGFGGIARNAFGAFTSLMRCVPPLAAITSAASIAGMYQLADAFSKWGVALKLAASQMNTTPQALERIQKAVQLAGGTSDEATQSLEGLTSSLGDAAKNGGQAKAVFDKLGISIYDHNGNLRSATDVYAEVIAKINEYPAAQDRATLATQLGGKALADIAEKARIHHKTIQQLTDEADRYRKVTEQDIANAEAWEEATSKLNLAFGDLETGIGSVLTGAFSPLVSAMGDWARDNEPAIESAVKSLADEFLKFGHDISTMWADIKPIWDFLNSTPTEAWKKLWSGQAIPPSLKPGTGAPAPSGGATAPTPPAGAPSSIAPAAPTGGETLDLGGNVVAPPAAPAAPAGRPRAAATPLAVTPAAATVPAAPTAAPAPAMPAPPAGSPANDNRRLAAPRAPAPAGKGDLFGQRAGQIVNDLQRDLGLTREQAAGIVGNLGHESGGFKSLQEITPISGRGGLGYGQWTGSRRRDFENWAAANKLDPKSHEANVGFLEHELQGKYAPFLARLKQTKTLEQATRLTHEQYETPADVIPKYFGTQVGRTTITPYMSEPARQRYARRAQALAGEMTPAPQGAPGATGNVDVNITHKNAPAGTTVEAGGTGNVNVAPVRSAWQDMDAA